MAPEWKNALEKSYMIDTSTSISEIERTHYIVTSGSREPMLYQAGDFTYLPQPQEMRTPRSTNEPTPREKQVRQARTSTK